MTSLHVYYLVRVYVGKIYVVVNGGKLDPDGKSLYKKMEGVGVGTREGCGRNAVERKGERNLRHQSGERKHGAIEIEIYASTAC